jgi:hypothetical protein
MAIQIVDLNSLDPIAVAANQDFITSLVQAYDPNTEVKRGPFHDLVLQFSAILATANQINMFRARQANSLQAVINDPTLAQPDVVDTILQNWRLTRIEGASAQGSIVIVLNAALVVTIAFGTEFRDGELVFVADGGFTSQTSAGNIVDPTRDKLLVANTDGTWQFTITATAQETGSLYNVPRSTLFIIADPTPPGYVKSYAGSDFTGGVTTETNEELIARFTDGAGQKAWSNRATADALVHAQPGFEETVMSIVGYGDDEMLRDAHSLWPGHYGGRVDIWSRVQGPVNSTVLRVTATLVSKVGPVGTWQFSIAKNDLPGFYDLPAITLPGNIDIAPTFVISSDIRGYDLSGSGFIPDITSATEGAYTRYQTATLQFVDTTTDATALVVAVATQDYDILARLMPKIDELNDFLIGREIISPAGDLLVRAPVPCFMATTVTIQRRTGDPAPDVPTVKQAVADTINAVPFGGQVTSGVIVAGVAPVLTSTNVVTLVSMSGSIRRPDGVIVAVGPSTTVLVVPNDPTNLVSARTVGFYQDPAAVTVILVQVPIPVI